MRIDVLFSDVTAVLDPDTVLENANIGITDGKIVWADSRYPKDAEIGREIRRPRRVLIPGMVNAHTHIPMTVLRGYADDYPLQPWLYDHIFPAEAKLDERGIYLGAKLGMLEALSTGTTAICDSYSRLHWIAKAACETGIRANLSNMLLWFDKGPADFSDRSFEDTLTVIREYGNGRHPLVTPDMGLHAVYTSDPACWKQTADFARDFHLRLQVHLAETPTEDRECRERYKKSPTEALFEAGVFDVPATAAHCVVLNDVDREILRQCGVTAVHNPVSNCKLASGIADTMKMQKIGISVALGTDGMASNNSHDLFEEMKLAALLAKVSEMDASACSARDAFRMATEGGAKAVGRDTHSGRIRVGYDADLVLLNFDAPALTPCYDVLSQLVYAASGRDVEMTVVNGRTVYENGEFPGIDHEQLCAEVREYCKSTFGDKV